MGLKYPYQSFPLDLVSPLSKMDFAWRPAINVVIHANHKHSVPIKSILDTGADITLFRAEIGEALGLSIKRGKEYPFGGVQGGKLVGYVHQVRLQVAGDAFDTDVVFSYDVMTTGILGQIGFFDHFTAVFDWTPNPPVFELTKIHRN